MDEEADVRDGAETKEARWVGRIVSTWDLDLDGRQALEALKVHDRHHLAGRGRAVVQDRSKTHSGDEVSIPPELRGTGHYADHCNDRDCGAGSACRRFRVFDEGGDTAGAEFQFRPAIG